MSDVRVEISEESVCKYSTTPKGYQRLSRELKVLQALEGSSHIPTVTNYEDKDNSISIHMEKVLGQNAKEWIGMQSEYLTRPLTWKNAKDRIEQYVDAEMDLLARGAMYRDLNLEHIIFNDRGAVLVDHEATIISPDQGVWHQNDFRGTWETMAPEEFPKRAQLTARTATYRTALVAHLVLTGTLPFKRFPASRADTYRWRRNHPPEIDPTLSKSTRRVFASALSRTATHRHKNPRNFLNALVASYESKE